MTKPTNEVVVTQERAVEVRQFHPQEVATPLIDDACGGTPGPVEEWHSEKLLLLAELKKWKQLALSL